jgi:hypothetical protein
MNNNNNMNKNLNINNYSNNDKIEMKRNINNNDNENYNNNSKSAMNNYFSIQKDTDDFLIKLNKQKEQSELKRDKVSLLINKQKQTQELKNKKNPSTNINDLIIKQQEKNINMNVINSNEVFKKQENKKGNEDMELDINEEYLRMINKIDEIEQMKMDYNTYSHLNQVKNYINNKGENITIDDIKRINGEIAKMIEILNEKEKLKKALENCNLKIKEKRQMIDNIEKNEENNIANIVEKEQREIEIDNNGDNKNENIGGGINENENKNDVDEVVEVEEEYDNDNDSQNKKVI